MTIKTKRNASLLNSSSLFVLGTASVLLGSGPAQAFDANALPTGGNVTGGAATIATSGNTLTVNQSSNRAIIDWRSFNIGANAQANFVQPGTSSIAVNRVNGSTDPSRIDGGLHANGQVWVLNPNGVFFGKTARVDAAGVVATTANINDKAFMAGSNKLQMTGGDSGQVVNEGHISVGEGGLAAFVAPSVRNSGTIRARLGKVTLAAGDTYTLDLAGDRLVEIGLGSNKAVVDQSGKIVNAGGVIEISAKAAGQVVDAVINTSGVTDASSVRTVGGKIVLGADVINVASTAAIKADGTSGGQITAVADKTGNYAGSYSAQGTTGDGGQIETSGKAVNIASTIKVNTSSAKGKTGSWKIDPADLIIDASNVGGYESNLDTTNVDISASNSITVNTAFDTSSQTNSNTLNFKDEDANGALTINLNAGIKLGANQHLTGDGSIVNVGATGLIQNGVDVASLTGTPTVNLAAATYSEALSITKSLDIEGAAGGGTIIAPTALLDTHTGHKYDADVKTAVFVNGASGVTLNNLTIDGGTLGANAVVFWNNASGTINNSTIRNETALNGGQTGQGLAVDATTASTLLVDNVNFTGFNKNAIDAVNGDGATTGGGDIALTVKRSTITGAGDTGTNAQNGILVWERAGGTVDLTIDNDHFSNLSYSDPNTATAAGVIVYGVHNGTVSVSDSDFTNVQEYISTADSAHEVNATVGNTFDGVSVASASLDQLFAIENHINDGTEDATTSLVRIKAGNVYATFAKNDLNDAIAVAAAGDTVNVQNGTYTIPSGGSNYLNITKALTLKGQSEAGTVIDASNASTYGLRIQADNVSLSDFTLKGPTSAGGYGIKVEPLENNILPTDRVNNFNIDSVTETGSYKNGLDLNGVASGTINNVTVSGTTHGTGIAITDSANLTLTGNTTTGNAWGGLALYQHNATYDQQVNNISVDATNSFGEANGVYMEDESASKDFGSVTINGYDHAVKATVAPNDSYTWLQNGEATAINFAVTNAANTASVQGWTGSAGDNIFTVVSGLKIQSAVDAATNGATINVNAGTYNEDVSIAKQVNLLSVGGQDVTTINGVAGTSALGTIFLKAGSDGSTIGSANHGFTIVGFDGPTAVENAAVYIQGANADTTIAGNHITANGDEAILTEYNAPVTGLTIDSNIIDGQTFTGSNPASGDQFSVPNVARGLVYISGGAGVTNTQNIIFTNNDVKGVTGGSNGNSNYLVTIDSVGSTITGNTFEGTVTGTSAQLRTRGTGAAITGNTFNDANLGNNAQAVEILNTAIGGDAAFQTLLSSNSFNNRSVWLDHAVGGSYYVGVNIGNAVNAATAGDTVNVGAGTYREQVVINKDLTLAGAGAGLTTIESPDVLSHSFDYQGVARKAVVSVEGANNVAINNLTIDGREKGTANSYFIDLGVHNASADIENVRLTGATDTVLDGGQHGVGLAVFNDDGVARTVTLNNSSIDNFQKNGAAFYGNGLTANVTDNIITGAGSTSATAQNGIVLVGAKGNVTGNTIGGISYTPDTVWASAIYLDDAAGSTVSGNTVNGAGGLAGSTLGVYATNSAGTQITGNTFDGVEEGIYLGTNATVTGNTFKNSANGIEIDASAAGFNISGNAFTNNLVQALGSNADVTTVLSSGNNSFDRTVLATGGEALYGDLQTAIDTEADHSTLNLAGTFGSGANINKVGDTLDGHGTAVIQALNNGDNGLTISADDVTIKNLEIAGPATSSYDTYAWGSDITRGIVVNRGVQNFAITDNNIHGTRNNILVNGIDNTGSITGNTIADSKSGISVQYTGGEGIDIEGNTDGGNANEWGVNLHLNGHYDAATDTFFSNSQKIATDADAVTQGLILATSILNNGWTVQDQGYTNSNRSAVTVATTGNDANQGSGLNSLKTIQAGIDAVINGGTVNVKAGTYDQALDIEKALNLTGAGAGQTIIKPTTLLDTGVGHKYDADVKTAVFVQGVSDVNISGVTIDGNGLGANAVVFWNNAGGSIKNSEITNPSAFNGAQTGQGIAVDATDGNQSSLLIDGVAFHDWDKNAIDAVTGDGVDGSNGGSIGLTVKNSTFTGIGASSVIAQNGILLWERGGGVVNATIDHSTFSNLGYTDPTTATAAGVLVYGVQTGTVKISNSTFNNVQEYVSTAASANEVDATVGNTFDGVNEATATLDQLFAIEDHMNHATEDASTSLVRVKAGQVYVTADKGDIADSVQVASAGDTVNIQNGAYTLAGELDIDKSLTLKGQSQAGTEITSNSTGYGIYVTGNDVSLSTFTYNAPTAHAGSTYGIKVEPGTTVASDRVTGFDADHLIINGGWRTGLDLNGVDGATIDNVSVSGVQNGNGIALTDSANVAITNTTTSGNAWGGLALYQTNNVYDQQVNNVSVDANSSFTEANGIYAQDQSATNDFGSINLTGQGLRYVAKLSTGGTDGDYTFFQKTQQGALDIASAFNSRYGSTDGTVQGYGGTGVNGDNRFTVGIDSNGNALSVNAALDQSSTGGIIDVLNGTYAENVELTAPRIVSFGNVTLNSLTSDASAAGAVLSGSVKAGSVSLNGATLLGGDLTLDTSAGNGAIKVASVDGAQNLALKAGSGNVALGNVGATTALGALNDANATTLTGGTYNAGSLNFGAVNLTTATALDTSAGNGAITVASVDGAQNLTLKAGSGNVSLGNVGATTALGAVVDNSATTLTGNTYKGSSFAFGGPLTLTAALTTIDSTQSATAAGNITFGGNIFGTTDGGQSLTLVAGPGTGAKSANGDITLNNAGTSAVRLGSMTVSGDDFSALIVDLAGSFTSQLTGNQVFSADTLNAGGNVTSHAGGNISGAVVAGGDVSLTTPGTVSGNISGHDIAVSSGSVNDATLTAANDLTINSGSVSNSTLTAANVTATVTGDFNAAVRASNSATVTANSIEGTFNSPTVSLTSQTVNSQVTADILNIAAQQGVITGDFAVGNVSQGLRLNGQVSGVNGQQLVVEGFALPAGTQIGANGQLILPPGTVIGLLSPGGGTPRVIMVQSVQELGALLDQGYSAIVIDLTGHKKAVTKLASN